MVNWFKQKEKSDKDKELALSITHRLIKDFALSAESNDLLEVCEYSEGVMVYFDRNTQILYLGMLNVNDLHASLTPLLSSNGNPIRYVGDKLVDAVTNSLVTNTR